MEKLQSAPNMYTLKVWNRNITVVIMVREREEIKEGEILNREFESKS